MTCRTLTLLFTDIVDSTRLFASLQPREAHRLQVEHFSRLGDQVDRHGGHQVKTIGDGVMASFEAAQDAIESAAAMQTASEYAAWSRASDRPLMRVGLSSGDVRSEAGDCFGLAVVEASRLCDHATGGQVLIAHSTRLLVRHVDRLKPLGEIQLKGMPEPTAVWEAIWSIQPRRRLRVVLADDAVLVREGIARVLEERGMDVIAQAGDAEHLLRLTRELEPDVAIVDVRMPPTHRAEGLEAAEQILATHPRTGVLILSQDVEPRYAERLLNARRSGVGYLLKERVADVTQFADAARSVAAGGTAFEPTLEAELAGRLNDPPGRGQGR